MQVINRKQAKKGAKKSRKNQPKKEKFYVDKTGNDKYNDFCACERNLLAAIK